MTRVDGQPYPDTLSSMSFVEIKAELPHLSAEDLRQLAISSWTAFLEKEANAPAHNTCEENDPALLAALDEAVMRADTSAGKHTQADAVRARIREWTTR